METRNKFSAVTLALFALFGFFSVAFGAYIEHGLKAKVPTETFDYLMTALRYNQLYSVLGACVAFATLHSAWRWYHCINLSLICFVLGIVFFCFSIDVFAFYPHRGILHLAPVGGFCFMLGWLLLLVYVLQLLIRNKC